MFTNKDLREDEDKDDGVLVEAVNVNEDGDVVDGIIVVEDVLFDIAHGTDSVVQSLMKMTPMQLDGIDQLFARITAAKVRVMELQDSMNNREHDRRLNEHKLENEKLEQQEKLYAKKLKLQIELEMQKLLPRVCAKNDPDMLYKLVASVVGEMKLPDLQTDSDITASDSESTTDEDTLSDDGGAQVQNYYKSRDDLNHHVLRSDILTTYNARTLRTQLYAFTQAYYGVRGDDLVLHQKKPHILVKGTKMGIYEISSILSKHLKMKYRMHLTRNGPKVKYEFNASAYNASGMKFHQQFELVFHVTQKKRKSSSGRRVPTDMWRVAVCLHPLQ